MPRLRSKLVLTLIAVLFVPVVLLLAELAVRVFSNRIDPLEVFVSSPQLREDTQGTNTSGLFEFDPLLVWRLKPGLKNIWWDYTPVTTNGAGLRMDHEPATRPAIRVVCLGDSVTFGYRVPVAPERSQPGTFDATEKTYPQLLEEALRQLYPGREIEVLPLACPGYSSAQGLAWLRRDIASLRPHIVTACFGFNDVRAAGLPDSLTMPQGSQVSIRHIMSRSQLMLALAKSAQKRSAPLVPPPPEPRSSQAEYVTHFAAMHDLCTSHGAAFVIILPLYRDPNTPGDYPDAKEHPGDPEEGKRIAAYRSALHKLATDRQLAALEVPELTEKGWPANAALFGERIHPNAAGHRLLAGRLIPIVSPLVATRLNPPK